MKSSNNRTAYPSAPPRASRRESILAVLDSLGADLGNLMLQHKKRLGVAGKKGPAISSDDPQEGIEGEGPETSEEPEPAPEKRKKGDVGLAKMVKAMAGR